MMMRELSKRSDVERLHGITDDAYQVYVGSQIEPYAVTKEDFTELFWFQITKFALSSMFQEFRALDVQYSGS